MRKTVYVLNVDGYAPEITRITYPLLRYWAHRIGAEFYQITARRWPSAPVTYEKFQLFDLTRARDDAWSIYVDSDALIHPETPDLTQFLPRDTVAHNGADMAAVRWDYDEYFWRDGRHIGSCNWFTMASAWCRDLWHPLEDLTIEQAIARIHPTMLERRTKLITPGHLLDDYVCSRNIARYGLKFTTLIELMAKVGLHGTPFWHNYTEPVERKVELMQQVLHSHDKTETVDGREVTTHVEGWDLPPEIECYGQ